MIAGLLMVTDDETGFLKGEWAKGGGKGWIMDDLWIAGQKQRMTTQSQGLWRAQ